MRLIDIGGHEFWDPFAVVSSAMSTIAGAATSVANAATSAWNSLPPAAQIGIVIGVSAIAIAASLGADAPVVGALDVGAISAIDAGEAAGAVGAVAAADPAVEEDAVSVLGGLASQGGGVMSLTSKEIGDATEVDLQEVLANEGKIVDRGW